MRRCLFEEYNIIIWSGSIGFMYQPHPVESTSSLSPIVCDVFDIFDRYGTLVPLSP